MKKLTKIGISLALPLCFFIQMTSPGISAIAADLSGHPRYVDFSAPKKNGALTAVTNPKDPAQRQPKKYYQEPEPDGELIAVDEFSRTYQTGETTFSTQAGGQRSTYLDENGKPALVDNTLGQVKPWFSAPYFTNTAGAYDVKLPLKITKSSGIKISKNGGKIELIPEGGDFSRPVADGNAVLYNNVFDGIDYQYTVLGSELKEDIVLNKRVEQSEFRFEVKTHLKLKEKNGAVIAYDKDENEPVFTLAAPEMSDASGEVSLNVTLSLTKEKGKNIVTVITDKAWLDSPERAYPVRIDPPVGTEALDIGLYCVEQGSPNMYIGDNSYPYVGYDDGIVSQNIADSGVLHAMTRTYIKINFNFSTISKEAKIDSAGFNIYHYTAWSRGATNFGLYEVDQDWNSSNITWNNQLGYNHTFIQFQPSNSGAGWLRYDIRETVNNYVQGIATNHGFVMKAEDERNMQAEVFHNKNGANRPSMTINWSIPDPVDENLPIGDMTVILRPISEKDANGKLLFDGIFADGLATPDATVNYWLAPDNNAGTTTASRSYKFPDSSSFDSVFPNGTKYKDKLSNWQTKLFGGLELDKAYRISATATLNGQNSGQKDSEKFLIYKIKQRDTFPYIANYYGVPLNTIMRDNRVQDTLVIDNNTIFIRNPNTEIPYNPPPLTDDQKKAIDSALMGRGLHCEYGFEPINLNTGNFLLEATDATIPDLGGDFNISRTYNSKGEAYNSLFGRRWSFEYSEYLYQQENGTVGYAKGDGKTLFFKPNGSGGYISPDGFFLDLKKIPYTVGDETYYRYEIHESDGAYRKFNAWGLLTDLFDAKGLRTEIQYDENYNIKSLISPSGKVYGLTADNMGRISKIILPNAAELRYEYNANGNLVKYTDALGEETRYVYDSQNRMTEWYDQSGNRATKNTYDSENRVTNQWDAQNHETVLVYSANKTVTTDANGNTTTYHYDDTYRTIKVEHPDGEVEDKTYGANNTLASNSKYSYTYNANGNITSETRADTKVKSYVYGDANNPTLPTKITDFDGKVTLMAYNAAGDLLKITRPDGKSETYEYDGYHRVTKHTNTNGKSESFQTTSENLLKSWGVSGRI
ncbi:MAG: DNRLRE domain-containing protein [Oscillospiraceae bacterium]|nr:DNRLRE domain-containing protein [Oscillospiraceae bacterium]